MIRSRTSPRPHARRLAAALAIVLAALAAVSLWSTAGAAPKGKIVLAWHAGFAVPLAGPPGARRHRHAGQLLHRPARRPHQEPGHRALRSPRPGRAFSVARTAKSATFTLRQGIKFHNGDPVTPQDVKFSYENYRGAKADVFKKKTERVEIVDDRTVRFVFKEPFLDFAILFGTANVAGPGWVVPEKYYKQVGADAFKQKPIGAGPFKLARLEPGVKVEIEAFDGYYRPVNAKQLVMIAVPEAATRVAMLERGEADIIYNVPGELINKVGSCPGSRWRPCCRARSSSSFPGSRTRRTPSATSACARRSASPSTGAP